MTPARKDGKRRVTLREAIAFHVRSLREHDRITQEELAAAAQRLGFGWGRSTIAAIEAGDRDLSAEELLALPYMLSEASAQKIPGIQAAGTALFEVLRPGSREVLALSDVLELTRGEAEEFIDKGAPALRVKHRSDAVVTEAERKAAARLGIDVERLQTAALTLWGHALPWERDRRVSEHRANASPRSLQALRGHITRELLTELAEHLGIT
jgi:hypothetical protein